jgi:hypothetical protein
VTAVCDVEFSASAITPPRATLMVGRDDIAGLFYR